MAFCGRSDEHDDRVEGLAPQVIEVPPAGVFGLDTSCDEDRAVYAVSALGVSGVALRLGVTDVDRARRFYEELGWRGQEVEDTVFFQAGGQAMVLWGRDKLEADSGVDDAGNLAVPEFGKPD